MASYSATKNNWNDNVKAFQKKWKHEEIFAIIDLYEARPCLWDVFPKDYHSREVTAKKHKH